MCCYVLSIVVFVTDEVPEVPDRVSLLVLVVPERLEELDEALLALSKGVGGGA